jgi:hypothetical protein
MGIELPLKQPGSDQTGYRPAVHNETIASQSALSLEVI